MLDPACVPGQSFLGKLLRLPLRLVPRRAMIPVVSGPNRGLRWRVGSSVHGCWIGTYESRITTQLAERVRPGMTAWDVGANAGYYTLLFSRRVGPVGQVFAFEPFPENLANLVNHVDRNRLANVRVVCAALGEPGLTSFRIAANASMGALTAGDELLRVPTFGVDELIERHGVAEPQLLKVDVEGAEGAVLRTAQRLLQRRSAVWFVALHGARPRRECLAAFDEAGYAVRTLTGVRITDPSGVGDTDDILATPD